MNSVKRLEIITSSRELQLVLQQLDAAGAQGYSVIRDVVGRGHGGSVSSDFDLAATTLSNVYIISFCDPEKVEAILARVQPLLKKFGGVCYVSDSLEA